MISINKYAIVIGVSYLMFGISLLIIPNEFLNMFGCPLDKNGEMVARTFASSLMGSAALHLLLRKYLISSDMAKSIFFGNFIFNSISAPVMLTATIQGTMNYLGFMPVLLNIFLATYSLLMVYKFRNNA
jgi:hypothetical protein